jgi:hypothetical protein
MEWLNLTKWFSFLWSLLRTVNGQHINGANHVWLSCIITRECDRDGIASLNNWRKIHTKTRNLWISKMNSSIKTLMYVLGNQLYNHNVLRNIISSMQTKWTKFCLGKIRFTAASNWVYTIVFVTQLLSLLRFKVIWKVQYQV